MILRSVMAALLLASCASPERPSRRDDAALTPWPIFSPGSAERGEAVARSRCALCHAVGRDGASPLAAAPALRDIGRRYPVDQLGEAFAEGFVSAHSPMPEFVLEAHDNRDLIAYLESIQARP